MSIVIMISSAHMSISLASGRFFSKSFGTDTLSYVLNQAAVKAIGWKNDQEAVGKDFVYGGTKGMSSV